MGWLDEYGVDYSGGGGGSTSSGPDWSNLFSGDAYSKGSSTSPSSGGGGGGWGSLGTDLFKGLLGPLLGAGMSAAGGALFPNTPAKIVGTDTRTGTGQGAESLRLGAAGLADSELRKAFADPQYGTLSKEMQAADKKEITRRTRKNLAAAGSLETGRGVRMADQAALAYDEARRKERNDTINSRFSQVGSLSSGFQPLNVASMPAQQNPWQTLIDKFSVPVAKTVSDAIIKATI